jgi:hypothetical protein
MDAMRDALPARREGGLAVGCILGEAAIPDTHDSPPRAPAEIRLGPAFSRYAVDLSATRPLSDYVRATALRDRIAAELDLFEAAAPVSRAAGSRDDHTNTLRDSYTKVMSDAKKNVGALASSLFGKRWGEVSPVPMQNLEYLAALAKLERLVKLRISFEAEVLQKGANVRPSRDVVIRFYLAAAAEEAFSLAETQAVKLLRHRQILAGELETIRRRTGVGDQETIKELQRGPAIPCRSDEISVRELFDNDQHLGREVFRMSRYLDLEPVPVGPETSSRLAAIGCVAKDDAGGSSQLDKDVEDYWASCSADSWTRTPYDDEHADSS